MSTSWYRIEREVEHLGMEDIQGLRAHANKLGISVDECLFNHRLPVAQTGFFQDGIRFKVWSQQMSAGDIVKSETGEITTWDELSGRWKTEQTQQTGMNFEGDRFYG